MVLHPSLVRGCLDSRRNDPITLAAWHVFLHKPPWTFHSFIASPSLHSHSFFNLKVEESHNSCFSLSINSAAVSYESSEVLHRWFQNRKKNSISVCQQTWSAKKATKQSRPWKTPRYLGSKLCFHVCFYHFPTILESSEYLSKYLFES